MQSLPLDWSRIGTVLCIGAHCDDIEIGCGATLIHLRERAPAARLHWLVLSGENGRDAETQTAARELLGGSQHLEVEVKHFRGSYFPAQGAEIKDAFEELKGRARPDLIFTHFLDDRHQDHRVIAELTRNTIRDHRILEYEIPKFEGDLGHPNVFVPVSRATVEHKVATLLKCFPSQRSRTWFDADVFRGLMRLRGVECNAESGFAEAFHGRKVVL
jgi:LmbE family N-acetylglucosaminyl deacetylase